MWVSEIRTQITSLDKSIYPLSQVLSLCNGAYAPLDTSVEVLLRGMTHPECRQHYLDYGPGQAPVCTFLCP